MRFAVFPAMLALLLSGCAALQAPRVDSTTLYLLDAQPAAAAPRPPRDLAVRLHDAALAESRDVVAVFDGTRVQPLFALYRRTLAADAEVALKNDMPVIRWQQALHRALADFSTRAQEFGNLNTADEFRQWELGADG